MTADRKQILAEISEILRPLTENLLPGEEITPDLRFGADLGLESISLANLSGRLQARYGTDANLVPFLASRPAGPISDITVGDFVEYVAGVLERAETDGGGGDTKDAYIREVSDAIRTVLLTDPEAPSMDADPEPAPARVNGRKPRNENTSVLAELAPDATRTVLKLPRGDVEVFTAGSGPALLLMHPMNVGAGVFARQFAALADRYQVICLHSPGVGTTGWDADLTLGGVARLYRTALAEMSITGPFHVLGSSYGGMVAQEFVLLHPTECASLTLVGCSYRAAARPGGVRPLPEVIRDDFDAMYSSRVAAGDGEHAPEGTRAELEELMLRCESMDPRIGLSYLDAFKLRPSHYARLPEIAVPTLILRGERDTMVPAEDAQVLHETIPQTMLAELPGAGHFPYLTHSAEFNALVAPFLAGHAEGMRSPTLSFGPVVTPRPVDRAIVIGTGRCGSTMLSELLTDEPDTLSVSESLSSIRGRLLVMPLTVFTGAQYWAMLSEPGSQHGHLLTRIGLTGRQYAYPENGRYAIDKTRVPPILRIALPKLTTDPDGLFDVLAVKVPQFPPQPVGQHHKMLLDLIANLLGKRRWVERTGASSMVAYPWLSAVPDAKVVYLTRNTRDTAKSMSKHPVFQLSAIRNEFHTRYGADPYVRILERPLPDASELPEDMRKLLPENLTAETLKTLDFDLGFYESMVEQMNGSAEQALADLKPKHLYRVRYEDILDEPIGELTKLGEWLGFADPAGWATQVAPKVKAPKPRPVPAG